MIISLIGYMGSGKSHISKLLSQKINFKLIDLDQQIILKHQKKISEIFAERGEIFFRKEEKSILEEILKLDDNIVLSLGGGTPVYYNNMELINQKSKSVFLQASVGTLAERLLRQKAKRPLIARLSDEELPEFIAKHLFERNTFYSQANFTINTNNKSPEEIVDEIIATLDIR
ncbi:shikimate kinase [Soonwooa buanensis]|uniref:Shikimate kinase n=1 Tax=Soonwooa buanensis TaxID=619805 RepID=A0A1T5DGH9_9FLAO|nr:shikimate kinase [Soonwooa buanensis]SKB70858.1 shikimate kinase [Soonwooa buanensis]